MPPLPKPAEQRRRRNKTAGARTLRLASADLEVPELPSAVEWHPMTVAWWADVWASPMAPEFDDSDRHGLYLLAVLVDDFWRRPSKETAAEIRLQRQCFGLSPIDRRRLQWEIDRGEQADGRRSARQRAAGPKSTKDPRLVDGSTRSEGRSRKGA